MLQAERLMEAIELYKEETIKMAEEGSENQKVFVVLFSLAFVFLFVA